MNSSNNFNVCPRCGTANGIGHKYCYQCGMQLKVPDEPIVCSKCNTTNNGTANFCRICGSPLKAGAQTKICPKCNSEVPADSLTCSCGYQFASSEPIVKPKQVTESVATENNHEVSYNCRGGRVVAIIALVFVAIFTYLIVFPSLLRPSFLQVLGGVVESNGELLFGYDVVLNFVNALLGENNGYLTQIALYVVEALVATFVISVIVHVICAIARIKSNKKQIHTNVLYLILAIISTLACGMLALAQYVNVSALDGILDLFRVSGITMGYCLYLIPAYYWFFYLYSLIVVARKI